jgi:hypothetical protein
MSVISASDFLNWKSDSVTQAFFSSIVDRIEDAKESLSTSAGIDPDTDNWFRGFIAGQRDVLDVRLQDVSEVE